MRYLCGPKNFIWKMKLIPIYTWNKEVLKFNRRSDRLTKQPWFQGVLLMTCVLGFTLIPRFDIRGAALTASVAYSVNALFLLVMFVRESRFRCRDFLLTRQELKDYLTEAKRRLGTEKKKDYELRQDAEK